MQKKKILFIMESLRIGGAEKSLLTLLSYINYEMYEVELLLFNYEGEFMDFLPKQVKLTEEDQAYKIFRKNRKLSPLRYLVRGDFKRYWHSSAYLVGCLWQRVCRKPLYIGWNHVKYLYENRTIKADVSIAYLERKCIYFNAEYVDSNRKIGFIHNDLSVYPYDEYMDRKYFAYYDAIATVSKHCIEVLRKIYPEYNRKFTIIQNMVSPEIIQTMANETISETLYKTSKPIIITVGRLVEQKGYDNAIKVCRLLKDRGISVFWYAIGDGPDREKLQNLIRDLNLEDNFILIGSQKNPYKWINNADIYVQPSRFEGFGITIAEAKALNKLIVCSDIPEFHEQLGERLNCYCKNNEMMADNIIANLKKENKTEIYDTDNMDILTKFYKVIEG